ncbi:hypothetical protein CBU09_000717 [Salmonella enterica subsp. houtenae serovar 40:z4,z24:-]|nr:hypothetical protein [Salmonella enterica subsp. enterica]EDU6340031.1 hypothetical protein [Salmonella enterica subsp. houtenae serovar 40:z4,z24:-]EDU6367373.1 hypothetical protein [Salmonella enterica subsp. houtenae serovar 40:z4,z24:-]EDX6935188.1 hypothetical protein [Salmonella enterica subsp. houtenae serovar 40:z4,z24:-]EDZ4990238.1 hypothetical protein [Salmonella enterica]
MHLPHQCMTDKVVFNVNHSKYDDFICNLFMTAIIGTALNERVWRTG